jgi:ShK domain-like
MKRSNNGVWCNGGLILVLLTLTVHVQAYSFTSEPPYGNHQDAASSSSSQSSSQENILYIDDDWDTFVDDFDATTHAPCTDLRPNCTTWAQQGRCSTDAAYMHAHCPVSCHVCHERVVVQTNRLGDDVPTTTRENDIVVSERRAFGWHTVTESVIEHDAVFVPGLGPDSVAQRLVVGHEEWIYECVQQLSKWTSTHATTASDEDRNLYHHDCLYFVVATDACQIEADQAFMRGNCALACRVCYQPEKELPKNHWLAKFFGAS